MLRELPGPNLMRPCQDESLWGECDARPVALLKKAAGTSARSGSRGGRMAFGASRLS